MEQAVIFIFGAINYVALETLWRGYSHWTMAIAGGICAVMIYVLNKECANMHMIYKCISGAVIITSVEFITGVIVNIVLKWNVWDYSQQPFNFLGQICLEYFIYWFLLCIPIIKLFNYFSNNVT